MWWLAFIACTQKTAPPGVVDSGEIVAATETAEPDDGVPEDVHRWVRRMSFDLRGIPPSEAELDVLDTNPDAWSELRDQYMSGTQFTERMVHLYAESWHTRIDVFDIVAFDYGLDSTEEYTYERAVGEEPLRIIAEVITADLPWSEVVTSNWTMANEILGEIWPIDYPEGGEGWHRAQYHDNRPTAGVLSTNGLWWRYTTTTANMNRRRAAIISKLLLCEDYLARPVAFSEADTSTTTTADAAKEDPYCLACHSSLDPIAASLFGFWWLSLYSEIEETTYHPEREALWEEYLGVAPAWYGKPISGLPGLGVSIAQDSRFYSCAVESMAETLWRRETTNEDAALLEGLRVDFLNADTRVKFLIGALTETEEYQTETLRMMTHDQFNSSIQMLTGFVWSTGGYDQLDSDETGYRLLMGGVDGISNKSPQRSPGLTWALVIKRAAEAAANHAVETELNDGGDRRLFQYVTLFERPGDPLFQQELQSLHRRLYGSSPSEEWITEISALWSSVLDENGPSNAWKSAASAMLRDPRFLSY